MRMARAGGDVRGSDEEGFQPRQMCRGHRHDVHGGIGTAQCLDEAIYGGLRCLAAIINF